MNAGKGYVFLAGSSHPRLSQTIGEQLMRDVGKCRTYQKPCKETCVDIRESVRGQDVFILQSGSTNPNDDLMELLQLVYACKTSSANRIIGVMPYIPYSRQSKMAKRGSIVCKLVARMLAKAGMNHLITMDLPQKEIQAFFDFPVDNLRAAALLLQYIQEKIPNWQNSVMVARQPSAANRATSYAERLRVGIAVIHGDHTMMLGAEERERELGGRQSPPNVEMEALWGLDEPEPNNNVIVVGGANGERRQSEACILGVDAGFEALLADRKGDAESSSTAASASAAAPAVDSSGRGRRMRTTSEPTIEGRDTKNDDEDAIVERTSENESRTIGAKASEERPSLPQEWMPASASKRGPQAHRPASKRFVRKSIRRKLPTQSPLEPFPTLMAKSRQPITVVGEVSGKIAILIDDTIDEVEGFVVAATVLKNHGASKVYVVATHGILSADAASLIEESVIDEVVVTNTVPHVDQKLETHKIKTVDVSILLTESMRRMHYGESMQHLFRNVSILD